jgi:hypothetical protein
MRAFLDPAGAGATVFGNQQAAAVTLANHWDEAAEAMARQLLAPKDFQRYQQFVNDYTAEHPFVNLKFVRPSVVQLWAQRGGADAPLLDSLGTIPEALADTSDRVQMMGVMLPQAAMWRTQLALQSSGVSADEVHAALARLDERLEHLSAVAGSSPQIVHDAVADVRRSMLDVIDRLDASSAATMASLHTERVALSESITAERTAILAAADLQRQAIALNVADLARQVVSSTGQQARLLVGLPFAAGYYVGRARHRRNASAG